MISNEASTRNLARGRGRGREGEGYLKS